MNGVRLADIPGRWRGAAGCGWLEYEAFNIRKTSHQKEAILWRQIRGPKDCGRPRITCALSSHSMQQPGAEATGFWGWGD